MQNQKDRVIIDTNLWISFLLTKKSAKLDAIINNKKLTLLFSQELVDEIIEVTQREKFRRYFPLDDIERLLLKIKIRAEFIKIRSVVTDCRPKRQFFIILVS